MAHALRDLIKEFIFPTKLSLFIVESPRKNPWKSQSHLAARLHPEMKRLSISKVHSTLIIRSKINKSRESKQLAVLNGILSARGEGQVEVAAEELLQLGD